jgi:hypothetical protein
MAKFLGRQTNKEARFDSCQCGKSCPCNDQHFLYFDKHLPSMEGGAFLRSAGERSVSAIKSCL